MRITALIMAAGCGLRAGGDTPKQYQTLAGKPLLRHTLDVFLAHPQVDAVQVVIGDGQQEAYATAAKGLAVLPVVTGGDTRQASVRKGLEALASHAPERVLIHDAARVFVTPQDISRVIDALGDNPAVLLAAPVVDTIKEAEESMVTGTLDRTRLWQAQTPQGFYFSAIHAAHQQFQAQAFTDDAALMEAAGVKVRIVEGTRHNSKVTTAEDMREAERRLAPPAMLTRTALGYDVHRFMPSPTGMIRLGGVDIPHAQMLEGHSDADVVLHAITDALLGTIADGDIGQHFSPKDPRWKGCNSGHFLEDAVRRVREAGGRITHVDVTVMGEEPKITPHREAMRARIAGCMEVPVTAVSVKATTTEGLGFTGRKEGLACMAVANVAFLQV